MSICEIRERRLTGDILTSVAVMNSLLLRSAGMVQYPEPALLIDPRLECLSGEKQTFNLVCFRHMKRNKNVEKYVNRLYYLHLIV